MPIRLIRALSQRRRQRTAAEAASLAQRASDLRARAGRGRLAAGELRELASLEEVYLGPAAGSRSARFYGDDLDLAAGLVARLGRQDGRYWFLGRDGRLYASAAHPLGRSGDLAAAGEAGPAPDGLEGLAWPYRQLCD